MKTTQALTAAMIALTALTACGTTGLTPKTPTKRPTVAAAPMAPVAAPAAGAVEKARVLLAAVGAKTKEVDTWTATATSEVTAPAGDTYWNTSKINFKHPATMCATVLKCKDGKAENTKLLYHGGDEVRLKTHFFGFIAIKITLQHDDSRLVDAYKRSLKHTQTKQLFETILHPQAQATWIGEGTSCGEAVDYLDIQSPASWRGITHEVVGISRRLSLPILRDCFNAKGQRIFHLELKGMKLNFNPKSDDFSLD